ncbi:MAG: DUF805 domain-containing protein [Alphaproteobacteria bacterium]|nr:DUF805 domain-containing protein [Alphaproteobacteria bacterium]
MYTLFITSLLSLIPENAEQVFYYIIRSALLVGMFFISILSVIFPLVIQIRRLHDIGLSAWWILVNCIPFVGIILFFVLLLWPGTKGDNKYGEPVPFKWKSS